uniref:Ankyrin repeat domain 52 n=1 Tax=Oncorhynchus kisutch TaxID=8019 RepID=A0A8C7GRL0_ONCKI
QDQERRTPLHAAACLGDVHIMDLLINSGNVLHCTPYTFYLFSHRPSQKAVGLLLRQDAEVNARDKFWQTPLHVAAANRATRCAEALIPKLSSLNVADRSGRTALHHAAHSGHLQIVKLLVSRSADAMCRDKRGYTPLHAAAASGQIEVVKYLLRLGSEVRCQGVGLHTVTIIRSLNLSCGPIREIDEPNAFGNTALHMACYTGQEAVANELVNRGANVNQPNHHGGTPLHLAAVSTNGALCLELLVNNGADVNMQSKEGKSPLHMAAIHGRFTRSQILIQNGGDIDCVDKYGNTPLHVAAKHGHELLISTLMTNGADTARQGIHGMFSLHLAVLYGFSDCCRKLLSSGQLYSIVSSLSNEYVLSAGFDINTPDSLGRTCLHAAASGGNVECLNLLLSSGADLSKKDKLGKAPLHYAAANGSYQCTVALVSAGAEVNELDQKGCSPLHYAAASQTFLDRHYSVGHQSEERAKEDFFCLEYLLDNGADPALRNTKGYSAVHYAAAHGNKQNLELLLEMSFNCLGDVESSVPVSPLHLAAYNGHCEALGVLSETLVSLDVRDAGGRTALYLAAQKGHAQCLEVLLSHGVSCHLRERRNKWTPLHVAASNGQTDCLLMLVNRGEKADIIDIADVQGQTALMLAALGSHTDCVHILLEKGAGVDAADKRGRTALHRAAVMGSEDCVSALLEHGASALCRDFRGRTPLHLAASCGHMELLRSLLQGATRTDPLDSMLDYSGYTPTHWAAYHGHEDCLDVLLEHKPFSIQEGNPFTPLHCALINGHDGAAELLVEMVGPQMVNIRDAKGRCVTPLHAAAYSESVGGLQLALVQGAEVNAVDTTGRSALMVAADNGRTTAVEILLHQAKADLTLLDVNDNTALHLACSKAHEMCALLILGEISDPSLINATNSALQMPLHIAARNGLATVVQVLLSQGAAVMAIDEEGHTPALACAPNKDVADCLALILSTMKPFPPKDASAAASFGLNLLKHCGIATTCGPLPNGTLHHAYAKDRHGTAGLDGCFTE